MLRGLIELEGESEKGVYGVGVQEKEEEDDDEEKEEEKSGKEEDDGDRRRRRWWRRKVYSGANAVRRKKRKGILKETRRSRWNLYRLEDEKQTIRFDDFVTDLCIFADAFEQWCSFFVHFCVTPCSKS